VGITVMLVIALPIVIELRTALAWFGLDVPAQVFYPAAALVLALIVAGLLLLPDEPGNPTDTDCCD
jgi:hypothetical protein